MTSASDTYPSASARPARGELGTRTVAIWLFAVAALVFAMVIVGGLTRLTDSGLSITEWRPVTGAIPPLSEEAWEAELEKYRQIPEYQLQNKGMSLEAFKQIYWWEWGHRLLGRLIGVAFFVPFVALLAMGHIRRKLVPRLLLLFALGGAQGFLGWFMVQSGLTERLDVSQYRLAAHLALATLIYLALLWTGFEVWRDASSVETGAAKAQRGATVLLGLVFLQIVVGAFVAGTDAGYIYNSWPLMKGAWVPDGLFLEAPWWLNFFENVLTIQFTHRMVAYGLLAAALWHWFAWRRTGDRTAALSAHFVFVAVLLQAALGIWTLVAVVPLSLGAAHQAGAFVVLALALRHLFALRYPGRAPISM